MKTIFFLLSCLIFGQAQATGYFRSGGDLEELGAVLAPRLRVDKPAFTQGYVAGVADATAGVSWCPTPQLTEEQVYQLVAKFMKNHPEYLNRSAATIVGDALVADFPCDKK
jgi:hypothetical protein